MLISSEVLLQILEDLKAKEFKKFKWFLRHEGALENFPAIPESDLENADRMDTVDKMLKTYCNDTIKVTVMVLEKISRNDLVQNIHKNMKEPAVTLQSESHRVEKLQKPAAEEHQLKTTKRPADHLMDTKDKKSIVLLGNGESLKITLIANIVGRFLSTLKKTTILSRTQVYEDDMYKFTCTLDLDTHCEDIKEVFKIQRPDMSLLVVEDGFDVSDVLSQIEKLKKTTGKPGEDFMVVLPPTCKNTNLPFRCCSVDQLIRELQKPAVDEHQLTTTKRFADYWIDMTVKKSIVLLGNGKSLKKTLITNILGRDVSTLIKTIFLSRTQVYENDMYMFICTPDLDTDCEDIREVFSKIQRPDMNLLVVEDGFDVSDVQRQIEKLKKMTGKPEEDFMVVLPLTCKNTNLPFKCCSVDQLIRELRKPNCANTI